jgi:TBC1 domain family member 13
MLHFFAKGVESKDHPFEKHHHVLLRIMYIYAKLNPETRYIQGMNEILAPIYYVFAQDPEETQNENIEADAFYCFSNLMKELKPRFTMIDHVETKSFSEVDEMMYFLRQYDPELCEHLDKQRVDGRFFAFRWLTLLLSQEFLLPDVLRIWDSILSDPDRFQFLTFICCAMLSGIRSRLLNVGFSEILQILQSYPSVDIQSLIEIAVHIRLSIKSSRSTNAQ